MKTLLTIKQQNQFLWDNGAETTWQHKWSTRGYGSSRIIAGEDNVIGKAGGCGYDRYGAALGNAIVSVFPAELSKLAIRECKGKRRNYKQAANFYGLFYDATKNKMWLDGGCGSDCMIKILNKIGFGLDYVGKTAQTNNGSDFYTLRPVNKNEKARL